MEIFKQILNWLTSLGTSGKVISTIIVALVTILLLFCACSCGTLHTTVRMRNPTDNPVVNLSITTNNPTSVDIAPNVSADSTIVTIR